MIYASARKRNIVSMDKYDLGSHPYDPKNIEKSLNRLNETYDFDETRNLYISKAQDHEWYSVPKNAIAMLIHPYKHRRSSATTSTS
jgi:hypothetical protein